MGPAAIVVTPERSDARSDDETQPIEKDATMRQSYKFAAGVVASLGLGIAVATAYASPGQMGAGMEHGKGGMHHGMTESMQHGTKEGMQHGKGGEQHGARHGQDSARGHGAGHGAGAGSMTPEERIALREKMLNATPEDRQQIAAAARAEMQNRAQGKGATPHKGHGPRSAAAPQAPEATEHQH
jgi:hypothetical protein